MSYKFLPDKYGEPADTILRLSDGACIPKSTENTDYQEFLQWKADGGVPEEAD